jgi:hypothetical protein
VVAGGHDIDPDAAQLHGAFGRKPKTTRRVLAIGEHRVQPQLTTQTRQMVFHHLPPCPAYDIAQKEKP